MPQTPVFGERLLCNEFLSSVCNRNTSLRSAVTTLTWYLQANIKYALHCQTLFIHETNTIHTLFHIIFKHHKIFHICFFNIWYKDNTIGQDLWEESYEGVGRPIPDPLTSGTVAETCIACSYSNHKIPETTSKLWIRNRLNVILATVLHWWFWV